jgi:hypothetical protein
VAAEPSETGRNVLACEYSIQVVAAAFTAKPEDMKLQIAGDTATGAAFACRRVALSRECASGGVAAAASAL